MRVKFALLALVLLLGSSVLLVQAQDTDVDDDLSVDDTTEPETQSDSTDPVVDDDADDYDIPEPEETMFGPSEGVSATVYFPEYPDKNFPLEEEISALIVFSNSGGKTFNISHCVASLHSQYDLSYYVQNFSSRLLAVMVEPRRQATIEFKFKPDRALEANQFWLSGYIVYNDTNNIVHVNNFVNTTINLVDLSAAPFIQFVSNTFVLVLFLGALGAPVYFYYFGGKPSKSGKSSATRSPRPISPDGDSQAIPSGFESAVYKQAEKSKAVKRNKDKGNKKDKKERKEKPVSAGAASGSEKQSE